VQPDVNGGRDRLRPGGRTGGEAPAAAPPKGAARAAMPNGQVSGGQAGAGQPGRDVTLVHLAVPIDVATILRAGVRANAVGPDGRFGVWCQPVLDSHELPEPRREALRRDGHRTVMAVHAHLPAALPVLVAGPDGEAVPFRADEAVAHINAQPEPRAWQVFVPRSITRREIQLVQHIPFLIGAPRRPEQRGSGQRSHPGPARPRSEPSASQRPPSKAQLLAPLVAASDPADADELLREAGRTDPGDEARPA
jgi:hypothetical protein